MKDISVQLFSLCGCCVAVVLVSVFRPNLLLGETLEKDLGRTRSERYLFWQRVFILLLGAACLLTGLAPAVWRLYAGIVLFAAVLAGYLLCNKRLTGLYLPWM